MPWRPGNIITADRLNYPEPEEVSTGFVVGTGWTLVSFFGQRAASTVTVELDLQNSSGGTLTGDSQGNITPDSLLGTIPEGWRPYYDQRGSYIRNDVNFGSFRLESDGQVYVVSTIAGGTILNGSNVRLSATYISPPPV